MGQQSSVDVNKLPKDLLLAETLKLNYRDTLYYCASHPRLQNLCETGELWEYKILHELGLEKEKYLPTITPMHVKYIELKSHLGVDYDSEYYLDPETLFRRASRLPDVVERHRLVDYFYNIATNMNKFDHASLQIILYGAAAMNDELLLDKYFQHYTKQQKTYATKDDLEVDRLIIKVCGMAEQGNFAEMDRLKADLFLAGPFTKDGDGAINQTVLDAKIKLALIRGGYLEKIKQFNLYRNDSLNIYIREAEKYGKEAIMEYFLSLIHDDIGVISNSERFLDLLLQNNRPEFSLKVINQINQINHLNDLTGTSDKFFSDFEVAYSAAGAGIFSITKEYVESFSRDSPAIGRSPAMGDISERAFRHNHLDIMAYLKQFPRHWQLRRSDPYNINPDIVDSLLKNNIIHQSQITYVIENSDTVTTENKEKIRAILDEYYHSY